MKSNLNWIHTLPIVLLGLLSGCGETGVSYTNSAGDTNDLDASSVTENQVTPGLASSSLSATQLSDGSTIIVQTALALEEAETNAVELGAANPENEVELGAANPGNTDQDNTTDETEQATTESETSTGTESTINEAQNIANPDVELSDTSFASVTTPGFVGQVLDDAIRISWEADPEARGYNVYKQADYYTTVFETEFIDTDVFDDDYYYEIQAFDFDDQLYYIATGLTVSASTLGRTDPNAPTPNENRLDDYEMVFSDEFNNTELDTTKWNTSFLWGPYTVINGEEQHYVDIANDPNFGYNPFTFDGNYMTINTIKTPPELLSRAGNQPYLSGLITSYDAFKFTYGYAETRAKFTHGRGYWPAFWLLNAYYGDADPEIDIMEFIGHNQDVMYHTYHYFDSNGELRSTDSLPVVGIDFTADFHTFAVEWSPGLLIFYVDGIETERVVDINVSDQDMYVLANQAVGGWWAGSPDDTTPFPGKYIIDYIRVYQRITPFDDFQFDQSTDFIPLNIDRQDDVIPNKRPPFSLWPEGYPTR